MGWISQSPTRQQLVSTTQPFRFDKMSPVFHISKTTFVKITRSNQKKKIPNSKRDSSAVAMVAAAVGEATPPPGGPPSRVSVSSSSSTPRRRCAALTSRFREPASPRRHAWVSLQGRLVGAEEATSAASAAPGLPPDEAVAWELFSPLHRVLLVATVAAASSRSHEARRVEQLQRSIHIRVWFY